MTAARRAPASITSPCMTASRWPTCSATTTSTTRPTAKTTATAPTTTTATIAATKARPTIPRSLRCAASCGRTSSPACCWRRACRCCSPATRSATRQNGNNNAYCQDNEIGWVGWEGLGREGDDLTDFIGHMTELRRRFPQIRSHRWLDGRRADGTYGVLWLTPAAEEMKEAGLEFPGRPFSRLCARPGRTGQRAALHRAQRRARRDRVQVAEAAGIQDAGGNY